MKTSFDSSWTDLFVAFQNVVLHVFNISTFSTEADKQVDRSSTFDHIDKICVCVCWKSDYHHRFWHM